MPIVIKPLHANAESSIRCNFEFDSIATDVSDLHSEKQHVQTTSTDAGMAIVLKSLHANADCSIRCTFELNSNVTNVSDLQLEKQVLVKTQIDDDIHAREATAERKKS
jgi:uncharacterized UPF0146 family protein